jgi:hypothetical protein
VAARRSGPRSGTASELIRGDDGCIGTRLARRGREWRAWAWPETGREILLAGIQRGQYDGGLINFSRRACRRRCVGTTFRQFPLRSSTKQELRHDTIAWFTAPPANSPFGSSCN